MSSAIDPLDAPHSDSDSERTLNASFPDYGDSDSARSPDATLLVGKSRTATLATDDELFSAALQRSPGATILTGTRVTANPANDEEVRYDDLQRFFPHKFVAASSLLHCGGLYILYAKPLNKSTAFGIAIQIKSVLQLWYCMALMYYGAFTGHFHFLIDIDMEFQVKFQAPCRNRNYRYRKHNYHLLATRYSTRI